MKVLVAVTKGTEFVIEVELYVRASLGSWIYLVMLYGKGVFCLTWTTCVSTEMGELAICSSLIVT